MPEYMITGPDGAKYKVTAPEGASEADALARVKAQHTGAPDVTGFKAPEGAEQIDISGLQSDVGKTIKSYRGREPGVDYTEGADMWTRLRMQQHSPEPGIGGKTEQELYLNKVYGPGNFRKDAGGNWLIKRGDKWSPVFPSGVTGTLGNIAAGAAASTPELAGTLAGTAAGGFATGGNPMGMMIGGGIGAGAGHQIIEGLNVLGGTGNKEPSARNLDTMQEMGTAMLFGGGGKMLARGAGRAIGPSLRSWGNVTPESKAVTQSLERLGVNPPISSVAPGMKVFEYDRRLRNMLMTDPKAAERMQAMDTRMGEVLQSFGLQGSELDRALAQIHSKTEALSAEEAGTAIADKLAGQESLLRKDAKVNFDKAKDLITAQINRYRTEFTDKFGKGIGPLGENFEVAYSSAEKQFRRDFNNIYGAIDKAAGGSRYVDLQGASDAAHKLIQTLPKQAIPQILKDLAMREEGDFMTYQEAHALRTTLREMSQRDDAALAGQKIGNIRYIERQVNDAIMRTQDQVGKEVAGMLRQADTAYGEKVVTFTNGKIHSIIESVRQGRAPNPEIVAQTILDGKSTAAAKQMWDILPEKTQSQVQTAYMKSMFDDVTVQGADGRWTVNPTALLDKIRDSRSLHPFISDNAFFKNLERMATDLRALGGDVDVTALNQSSVAYPTSGAIRMHLERALGATRALAEDAEKNPRAALTSDNPELARLGARWFLTGGEARTLEGARKLDRSSPEWQKVEQYAVKEMFKSALKAKGATGETVYGKAIEEYLSKLTPKQQDLLFGGTRKDDIEMLARQAKALFPELEEEFGGSLAAAEIKGGFSKGKAGFIRSARGYLVSSWAGKIADSPQLTKLLIDGFKTNPQQARGLLSYVLQGGLETYTKRQAENPPAQPPEPDPMMFKGLEPKPKEPLKPNLFQ